jgi:exonuclease III
MCANLTRKWRILCWNVRGLNSDKHQRALRSKIEESQCSIICIQETKCEVIAHKLIRNCYPKRFDSFVYSPSVGASGGILVLWNSAVFNGNLVELQRYGVIVNFTSIHSGESWNLVSVYGPCQGELRDNFVNWLYNLHIPTSNNWLLLGDFNFIRSSDN